jgi:hypothetical protein
MICTTLCLALLAPAALHAKARPLYYKRALSKKDLEGRTLRELNLMRNAIFARVGKRFRKKWLHDYFSKTRWYRPRQKPAYKQLTKTDWSNSKRIVSYENKIPKGELMRRQRALAKKAKAGKLSVAERVEVRLLSIRLGKWVGAGSAKAASGNPLENPALLDRQITLKQLSDLSLRDLRLLRNMVYARRGRRFQNGNAKWYRPVAKFAASKRLRRVDWRNIRVIRSLEKKLGGPLKDRGYGWFVEA